MFDVTRRLYIMCLPKPLLFIIIIYYATSSTAQHPLQEDLVCVATNSSIHDVIFPHVHIPIRSNVSLHLADHLQYSLNDKIVRLTPPHFSFKSSTRKRKRTPDMADRLRCGDPYFAFNDTMEAWMHVVLHSILGFMFGAASTIAIGFMSAMWWYTTSMATRKAKNEKRTQRLEEIMYRNAQGCDEFEQSPMCPICLDDFPDLVDLPEKGPWSARREYGTKVLLCGHKYHNICISEWLQRNDSCPICRLDHPVPSSPKNWGWLNWGRMHCKSC
eukprot:Phypoly_transcript_13491.p1 GENE.Phypoly_transcript_13491~~Phypoly_transcript_13491.p1  ORF type:complete len:272 (+),score=22.56 Phypoly_transcript_13491:137-952(+)